MMWDRQAAGQQATGQVSYRAEGHTLKELGYRH